MKLYDGRARWKARHGEETSNKDCEVDLAMAILQTWASMKGGVFEELPILVTSKSVRCFTKKKEKDVTEEVRRVKEGPSPRDVLHNLCPREVEQGARSDGKAGIGIIPSAPSAF